MTDDSRARYRPFLIERIASARQDLLVVHLMLMQIDELELLFGGLIMVANGFPTKYVEQLEHVARDPPVVALAPLREPPASDDDDDLFDAPAARDVAPAPAAAAEPAAEAARPAAPSSPGDDSDDDDAPVAALKARLRAQGERHYVDRLSGISFDMDSYALGPAADAEAEAPPDKAKMKLDLILAVRAMDWLPASFKTVVKSLREGGWAAKDAPDGAWNDLVVELFDAGQIQLSFKKNGLPFEVW